MTPVKNIRLQLLLHVYTLTSNINWYQHITEYSQSGNYTHVYIHQQFVELTFLILKLNVNPSVPLMFKWSYCRGGHSVEVII